MGSFNRNSFLATKGNMSVKSGGEVVWTKYGANVAPGEFIVYDPKKNISLSVADLDTATDVRMGVGIRQHNSLDKVVTTIKHVGGENFNAKRDKVSIKATAPSCGCSQVVDIFPTCLECNENYSLGIALDDYLVRSRYDFNDIANYVFTADTLCGDCDDCTEEADALQLMQALKDKINKTYSTELKNRPLPRFNPEEGEYQPFKAAVLYAQSYNYNLPLSSSSCENCGFLPAIGGVTVNGVTTTFVNTLDPADNTRSLITQAHALREQLNDALEVVGGSAFLEESSLACCPYRLEVNTCDDGFELLDDEGVTITPDSTSNPLQAVTKDGSYKTCSGNSSTFTPTVGLRIFVEPVTWETTDEVLRNTNEVIPNSWIRSIDVQPLGDAWENGAFNKVQVCEPENLLGSGLVHQYQEVRTEHQGGTGRNKRRSNRNTGLNNIPDKFSNASSAMFDAQESYCIYAITEDITQAQSLSSGLTRNNRDVTYLGVPQGDTTTQQSVELYVNKLNSLGYFSEFATCLGIVDDVVNDATEAVESTVDVSTNDTTDYSDCTAVTYETSDIVNAGTVSITNAGVLSFTPTAAGEFRITYKVFCDDVLVGAGSVTGDAAAA